MSIASRIEWFAVNSLDNSLIMKQLLNQSNKTHTQEIGFKVIGPVVFVAIIIGHC